MTTLYNQNLKRSDSQLEECKEAKLFFDEQKHIINYLTEKLSDEKSKKVFKNIIKYRSSLNINYINEIKESCFKQYIDPIIKSHPKECVIDAGACFGKSTIEIKRFLDKQKKRPIDFKALIVEPDKVNFGIAKKHTRKINCFYENYALGDVPKEVFPFHPNMFPNSMVVDASDEFVETETIDRLCKKYSFEPTYIKMDIEGFEMKALKGATFTINKYKPNLAISIYHSNQDLLDIPMMILENFDFYHLYVRHYSGLSFETVLYCIP